MEQTAVRTKRSRVVSTLFTFLALVGVNCILPEPVVTGAFAGALNPVRAPDAVRAPAAQMSTPFSDLSQVGKKKAKNAKVDTTLLKGYTVGSRAPASARRSGTTIKDATGRSRYKTLGGLKSQGSKDGSAVLVVPLIFAIAVAALGQ